jgi:site-specific recombinase XerD
MPKPRSAARSWRHDDAAIEHEPVDERWARIADHAPILAATCSRLHRSDLGDRPTRHHHLGRCRLRLFASWIIDHDPTVVSLRQVNRQHIEHYKLWLATRENQHGQPLKRSTINLRLSTLRVVLERLIEWDHPDTPTRNPIMWTDLPKMDEPLPKFLDDDQAAKFMAAAVRLDPQRRLIIELLARTGLRVTEFCELTDDAIVTMNETNWLRVPVGKLHTDRYVPLLPHLVELHREWLDWNGPNTTGRLISNKGRPLNRFSVSRTVAACARIAGIGHVHPHQLRHTLATQSINNGMSLEAIAANVGTPIDAHDPRLRPHRRPHRRRRILRRRRQSRPALHHPLDNITGIRAVRTAVPSVEFTYNEGLLDSYSVTSARTEGTGVDSTGTPRRPTSSRSTSRPCRLPSTTMAPTLSWTASGVHEPKPPGWNSSPRTASSRSPRSSG